ncbi:helix-turn-helix domain-containing protein [Streptomyces sp. NPDC048442]|uniref:PucR family transcriptional regulator n=1 Tax=Streptomyces sp. NPDC048442 TaxID=3154823 RepID=UPI00343EB776
MPEESPNTAIAILAEALRAKLDGIVVGMAELVVREIEFYRNTVVSTEELQEALRHSVGFILTHLADPKLASVDVSAPLATGRKRALQGAPLPEVLRVYRLSFAYFWDQLLAEAQEFGESTTRALLVSATRVWALSDIYSSALTDSYREAVAERMVETDRRRSALVAALLDGQAAGGDTGWELARTLGFPYQGRFVVLMAEAAVAAESPLPHLEARLRALDVASAWRAQSGHEIAVLSLARKQSPLTVVAAVRDCATGRVGVSPVYHQLDHTESALRYAQVALESLTAGVAEVRQLDDTPLTELVMSNLDTTRRAVNRVLGGLLSLPEGERTTLLATARAWLKAHGSAAEAAQVLYCHENTVRYRIRRLEEYLRGPLDDPTIIAELALALNAVGTFPTLLEQRTLRPPSSPRSVVQQVHAPATRHSSPVPIEGV